MSARRFGDEALGDPGFVLAQARGRSVRLGTADRVLVFMAHAPLGPAFRREVEAFLAVTGVKASVLGEQAAGNRSLVGSLRKGASPCLRTVDRVRAWMAAHASAEETAAIRAGIDDGRNPVEAAGPGINLEEEGGRGVNGNGSKYFSTRDAAAWLGSLAPDARPLPRERRRPGVPPVREPGAVPGPGSEGMGFGAAAVDAGRRAGRTGGKVMRTASQARWTFVLTWAAVIVLAVWTSFGSGVSGPAGGIEAELTGDEAAEASRVRRSEALIGELGALLRRTEEENARLRARLARDAGDSRAVIDRQAAAIDALTRRLEARADLPAEDLRPGADTGGKKERADGGPMGCDEAPGP